MFLHDTVQRRNNPAFSHHFLTLRNVLECSFMIQFSVETIQHFPATFWPLTWKAIHPHPLAGQLSNDLWPEKQFTRTPSPDNWNDHWPEIAWLSGNCMTGPISFWGHRVHQPPGRNLGVYLTHLTQCISRSRSYRAPDLGPDRKLGVYLTHLTHCESPISILLGLEAIFGGWAWCLNKDIFRHLNPVMGFLRKEDIILPSVGQLFRREREDG